MSDDKSLLEKARETLGIHENLSDEQAIALIHLWLSDKLPVYPLPEFPDPPGFDIYWQIRFGGQLWRDIPPVMPTL